MQLSTGASAAFTDGVADLLDLLAHSEKYSSHEPW
jgi:hypothetical protein